MKSIIPGFFILLLLLLLSSCTEKQKEQVVSESKQKKQMTMSETSIGKTESELVRKGVIDVESIDRNKDGKIYECPMDWNVLSDNHGDCPVCGMKLKEYSLNEIKSNLEKHNYDYKK